MPVDNWLLLLLASINIDGPEDFVSSYHDPILHHSPWTGILRKGMKQCWLTEGHIKIEESCLRGG